MSKKINKKFRNVSEDKKNRLEVSYIGMIKKATDEHLAQKHAADISLCASLVLRTRN